MDGTSKLLPFHSSKSRTFWRVRKPSAVREVKENAGTKPSLPGVASKETTAAPHQAQQILHMANSQPRSLGEVSISIAIDTSGSTFGGTLTRETQTIREISRLISPRNEIPIKVLPWCDKVEEVISLPKESASLELLDSSGGTNPGVLYSSLPHLKTLSSSGLWFLLTDGKIEDKLVQDFALKTAELGLHGIACIIICFGPRYSAPPAACDISVGIAVFAVSPDCLFLFHDEQTSKLFVLQAKGCFKSLLPKLGESYEQPLLVGGTTWEDLPHITYQALSQVKIPPPRKVSADELALQGNLKVKLEDLYSGAIGEESVGAIIQNEDNLKSLVIAEMTRGRGEKLQSWLKQQQKALPMLTRDRPDIKGKAQQAVTEILHKIKTGEPENNIKSLRHKLLKAHEANWRQIEKIAQTYADEQYKVVSHNKKIQSASSASSAMSTASWRTGASYCGAALSVVSDENASPYPEWQQKRRRPDKIDSLFLPGFNKSTDPENPGFVGNCMLCHGKSILTILLKSPPEISTPNFPALGSRSALAFPLAMSNFAETDIVSLFICCDPCALYLVRNYISPYQETVTGALPLVPFRSNQDAWLEVVDISLKGRFRKSDVPLLFLSILDQMIIRNETRTNDQASKALFHDAIQWARQDLLDSAHIPSTLSPSFAPSTIVNIGTRSLTSLLSDEAILNASSHSNSDLLLLRYPVPGFIVLARLMRDSGCSETQIQTQLFQRLIFHLTEMYYSKLADQEATVARRSLEAALQQADPNLTLLPGQDNYLTGVFTTALISQGLLDQGTIAAFQTLDEFGAIGQQAGPAIAVFLRHLAKYGANYSSPVDCFNALKVMPTLAGVISAPLAAIAESFKEGPLQQTGHMSTSKG